jgi:DNA-binding transcriptional ArsR family regulator
MLGTADIERKPTAAKIQDCSVAELSPQSLVMVADFFKVLSEPSRLQIVCALRTGPYNVTEIIEQTGLGQANVSKHLKILAQAGIVSRQQRGVSAFYKISNYSFFQLCEIVCETLADQLNQQTKQIEEIEAAAPNT